MVVRSVFIARLAIMMVRAVPARDRLVARSAFMMMTMVMMITIMMILISSTPSEMSPGGARERQTRCTVGLHSDNDGQNPYEETRNSKFESNSFSNVKAEFP